MDDLISRQAVLDAMYELCNTGETLKENPWRDNPHIDAITDVINNLPSVNSQEPCEMTAEEYRQRMIQAFHNTDCDELIAICVLPTEKEFKNLEWLLKNHYKKEPCGDAISRTDAIRVASGYCHWTNIPKELAKLPSVNTEKTGHWKYVQYDFDPRIGNWHCSECRNIVFQGVEKKGIHNEVIYKFCPWCGANMVEPQESSESCEGCPNICVMYESNMKGCKDKMEGVEE